MKRYVFDSFAMVAFLEDEPGATYVERALRELVAKKARGWMSVINWGEVYYSTYREEGEEVANAVLALLAQYPIEVMDADQSITLEAAKLKGKYKVAYADCFAVALAVKKRAAVITGDPEFRHLEDEVEIQWIE